MLGGKGNLFLASWVAIIAKIDKLRVQQKALLQKWKAIKEGSQHQLWTPWHTYIHAGMLTLYTHGTKKERKQIENDQGRPLV